MQLLTLHFDEEGKNYYLLNGGYYVYGRNGWDVEQYFDFAPRDISSAWMNEVVRDLNRIGWQTKAV